MARKKKPDGEKPRNEPARPAPASPLAQAQELVWQAFDEADPGRRVELARAALALSADCVDAYVLLAEHTRGRKEALGLFEQAVAAGERALGPAVFRDHVGHFWGLHETRPYMRARVALAEALWQTGRREEAIGHLRAMLRLNPEDNQGLRYTQAAHLLFLDRDADLATLRDQYPEEESAMWAYTRAILAFRQQGDTIESRRLLKTATKANKYVPAYLIGAKYPAPPPESYSPGRESEALVYIVTFLAGWTDTAGAIAWVRQHAGGKKKSAVPEGKGPLGLVKRWLKTNLTRTEDVWQADCRVLPTWIPNAGVPVRPWAVLVTSGSHDLVLAHLILQEKPSDALVWDTLAQAMQHPAASTPHRPTELQVPAGAPWDSFRPHLEEIEVGLTTPERLDQLDGVFAQMCDQVCGEPEPGLLDVVGITPEAAAGFYDAAAEFFRQSPWKKVGYEAAIRIECAGFPGGPWYAVLMGQSGLSRGLAVYHDLETLRQLWAGGSDEDNARINVATAVTFGEPWTIPVADLEAALRHGWTVARPDAYPGIMHSEGLDFQRPPEAWELTLIEGGLRAIPDFLSRRKQDDPAREEFAVATAAGPLKLVLSWVD